MVGLIYNVGNYRDWEWEERPNGKLKSHRVTRCRYNVYDDDGSIPTVLREVFSQLKEEAERLGYYDAASFIDSSVDEVLGKFYNIGGFISEEVLRTLLEFALRYGDVYRDWYGPKSSHPCPFCQRLFSSLPDDQRYYTVSYRYCRRHRPIEAIRFYTSFWAQQGPFYFDREMMYVEFFVGAHHSSRVYHYRIWLNERRAEAGCCPLGEVPLLHYLRDISWIDEKKKSEIVEKIRGFTSYQYEKEHNIYYYHRNLVCKTCVSSYIRLLFLLVVKIALLATCQ